MKCNQEQIRWGGIVTAALAVVAVLVVTPARASMQNVNPGIAPIQSHVHGHSYGEWTALWWQWVIAIPGDENPLIHPTCDESQDGPVFFTTDGDRTCTISPGTSVLMPLYTWVFGSGVWDCDPTVPGVECDVETLRATATWAVDQAEIMEVWIDGVPMQNEFGYRAASPDPFEIYWPENSAYGVEEGTYYPQVSDGYWIMLRPFTPGEHSVRVKVSAPGAGIDKDSTVTFIVR